MRIPGAGSDSSLDFTDLGLLVMALIWGVNFPIIKACLDEIPPLAFNALRFPLASLAVFLAARTFQTVPKPKKKDWPRLVALGIVGNLVYQCLFIFGADITFAGNASILLATTPAWTLALSSAAGHEKPGPQVWFGVLATMAGMTLVVLGSDRVVGIQAPTLAGDLLIVAAAVTWSVYSVGSRGLVRKYGALPVTAWTLWVGSAGLFVVGLPSLTAAPLAEISPAAWVGVGYSGVLAIGLGYILWYRGVQKIGNSRTAAFSNLTPVVALVVAWLWLAEVPGFLQILGAAVVLAGLSLARMGRAGQP